MMRLSQGGKTSREVIEDKYPPPVQIFHAMVLFPKMGSIQPVILRFLLSRQTSVHLWQIWRIRSESPQFFVGWGLVKSKREKKFIDVLLEDNTATVKVSCRRWHGREIWIKCLQSQQFWFQLLHVKGEEGSSSCDLSGAGHKLLMPVPLLSCRWSPAGQAGTMLSSGMSTGGHMPLGSVAQCLLLAPRARWLPGVSIIWRLKIVI